MAREKEEQKVFASPKNGMVFWEVFGHDDIGEIRLINLLNAILDLSGQQSIKHLTIVPMVKAPQIPHFPQGLRLDTPRITVTVTTYADVTFLVDMRVKTLATLSNFIGDNQIYRGAKARLSRIQTQALAPKPNQVFCIIIVDFSVFGEPEFRSICTLDEPRFKDLVFIWIELPNFRKIAHEARTTLEKWLYFFKYAHTLQGIPQSFLRTPELVDAFNSVKRQHWAESKVKMYRALGGE